MTDLEQKQTTREKVEDGDVLIRLRKGKKEKRKRARQIA